MTAGELLGQAARLRAVTRPLDEAPDLLACAGSEGLLFRHEHGGLAASGEALRIDLPAGLADSQLVSEVLAAMACDDPLRYPGTGPVALGALPFDPAESGHLVVPRVVFGRDGDRSWVTTVGPADAEPDAAGAPVPPGATTGGQPPEGFRLTSAVSHHDWMEMVAAAVDRIGDGDLDKVVLARRVDIEADRPFVVTDLLERLTALYPSCMIFSVEGFIGASPELLVRRHGALVESHPLAGTVARSGDSHGDELLVARLMGSDKTRREHRWVVDAIADALAPLCEELQVPDTPSVMGLRNVSHLGTHISGRLLPGAASALDLVARIHPTPAVGGTPTADAVAYIQKVEGFERGRYAGPVGWVDSRGDGCFALGIRCAEIDGTRASLYAGNGIVAGSDPADELAETQLKLQALLAAVVRP